MADDTKSRKKQIELITNLEEVEVLGDKNRLKQIFLNVIDNTIKYSYQEGKVFVDLMKKEEQAVISVTDQGIGIEKEHLPFIKHSFYQANNQAPGAGGGLAIVKKIVDLHGGTICIASKKGSGTRILIKLPL